MRCVHVAGSSSKQHVEKYSDVTQLQELEASCDPEQLLLPLSVLLALTARACGVMLDSDRM
jgi:hypothetical protein